MLQFKTCPQPPLEETFKTGCDPKCLKAQLKSYYDKLCDGKMKPRGGKGTDVDEIEKDESNQGMRAK